MENPGFLTPPLGSHTWLSQRMFAVESEGMNRKPRNKSMGTMQIGFQTHDLHLQSQLQEVVLTRGKSSKVTCGRLPSSSWLTQSSNPGRDCSTMALLTSGARQFFACRGEALGIVGCFTASSISPDEMPVALQPKLSQDIPKCPLGVKSTLHGNQWSNGNGNRSGCSREQI